MRKKVKCIWGLVCVLCLVFLTSHSIHAALIIDLSPGTGGGTLISFSGSGVADTTLPGTPGGVGFFIDFNDFPGSPFNFLPQPSPSSTSGIDILITGSADLFLVNGVNAFTSIEFEDDGTNLGRDDLILRLIQSVPLNNGGTYTTGSGTIDTPLIPFTELTPGSYVSSDGEAIALGGVTLRITAVPIPSAMLLMGSGLVGLIGWRRWNGRLG